MPMVKSELGYLAELASFDLNHDEESVLTEGQIQHTLRHFSEFDVTFTPVMTPVIQVEGVDDKYFTDVRYLVPFMESYDITNVAEALDMVAEANGLPAKSVGIIECDCKQELEEAKCCKNGAKKNALLTKINRSLDLTKKLADKGYPIAKKKSKPSKRKKKK